MKKVMTLLLLTMVTMTSQAQELKQISYQDGEQKLKGLITANTAKKGAAVLILPAWKGIDNEAKQAALQLEKEGYIAFIADIYGEGNIPSDNTAASKIAGHYKTDYKAYQHRITLALEQLKKEGADPNKIAIIGYCFGGTGALEAARAHLPVNAVVSIHGGLSKSADRPNGAIKTKVLVEHPADDKSVSKEDYDGLVKELNQGKADWQIITYANSGHTFTNPESPEYNPVMAERAWAHTLLFLKEVLN
ncbi:dienelactone hydrolase family protein [Sphingobacterium sp. UBA5996]|uniref:dienelactone hydrolase family protein n=1 Tax=Sphingobacterium sp. UBA5996 TaxID=1947505 RepID=UPI0025DCDEDF|nr:dienelactone hydrolase family protein [Sphingobacterium sp. UBA5996]